MRLVRWVLVLCCLTPAAWGASVVVDGTTAITMGEFKIDQVTLNMDSNVFNPAISAEYRLGEAEVLGIGAGFARSKTDMSGEWDSSSGKHSEGDITVERTSFDVFVRWIPTPFLNLRAGFRSFKFEYTDGLLEEWDADGNLTERAENAVATAKLKTGFDGEANLVFGKSFQFRLGAGASYYPDAEYEWEYDKTTFPDEEEEHVANGATYNAYSARFTPGLAFAVNENLMVTADYSISATLWKGDTEDGDIENYPGFEVFTGLLLGVEYRHPLGP